MSQVTLFSQSGLVEFNTKAGVSQLTGEAAMFKGGAALAALKDAALDLALTKAHNGKYRAAAEIFMVAFPSQHKAFEKLYKSNPWGNKTEFGSYLLAMELAEPGKSGEYNKKQQSARALMRAVRGLPAFARTEQGEVVDAQVTEVAAS